jgi:C1A family cysteine protease
VIVRQNPTLNISQQTKLKNITLSRYIVSLSYVFVCCVVFLLCSVRYCSHNFINFTTKMIYNTIIAATIVAGATASSLSQSSPETLKALFDAFKRDHGKAYSTQSEELDRFDVFVANLKHVDDRNAQELAQGGEAVHGITQFSDMSQEEFEDMYLSKMDASKRLGNATIVTVPEIRGTQGLVDWTGKYTTAVKNQGYCGSCWAFSASEQIESDSMRTLGVSYTLSPEQLVECDSRSSGCNGGWPEWAYDYVKKAGGIETESDYPYSSASGKVGGTCHATSSKYKVTVTGYSSLKGESQMGSYVASTGPLSICLDASTWNSYTGGIMSSCGKQINHAVQAVGVDTSSYWKVRNSWGASWGESGFIRLKYGQNTCGLTNDPAYTSVKKV